MRWSSLRGLFLSLVAAFVLGWTACGSDGGNDRVVNDGAARSGCVDCHLDQVALKLLAVEEDVPEDTGEG